MQRDKDFAFSQKRLDERRRRLLKAHMTHPRHGEIEILVRDVSKHGIGGKCDYDLLAGEAVTITLPSRSPVTGRIAWRTGLAFGVRLDSSIDPGGVRTSSELAAPAYQVPEHFQPAGDFKRPGFGRKPRD